MADVCTALLNYSQAAPFGRAFKACFGQSPEQARETVAGWEPKM